MWPHRQQQQQQLHGNNFSERRPNGSHETPGAFCCIAPMQSIWCFARSSIQINALDFTDSDHAREDTKAKRRGMQPVERVRVTATRNAEVCRTVSSVPTPRSNDNDDDDDETWKYHTKYSEKVRGCLRTVPMGAILFDLTACYVVCSIVIIVLLPHAHNVHNDFAENLRCR